MTPSEVDSLRSLSRSQNRLLRLCQVRERERQIAKEKREIYQGVRRRGRDKAVKEARGREMERIRKETRR